MSIVGKKSSSKKQIFMGLSWQDPSASPSPKSKKPSPNSGQKLPNDILDIIGSKANAKTKSALKASSKFLKSQITVVRPPKVINYNTEDFNKKASNSLVSASPRKILERYKNKNDIIEGDFIQDPDQYMHYGSYFFTLNKTGKKELDEPELHGNGDASVPAWVIKKGIEHGHSLKKLIKVYSQGRFRFAIIPEENIPVSIKKKLKKDETYVYDFDEEKFTIIDAADLDLA